MKVFQSRISHEAFDRLIDNDFVIRASGSTWIDTRAIYCDDEFTAVHIAGGIIIQPDEILQLVERAQRGIQKIKGGVRGVFSPELGGGRRFLIAPIACRKCPKCRVHRLLQLSRKADDEISYRTSIGHRSWLGTLTLHPEARTEMWARTVHPGSTPDADMGRRAEWILRRNTEWLRRVRYRIKTRVNGNIRYLRVVEFHKDGTPHLHLLLHGAIRKHYLEDSRWDLGFTRFKLIRTPGAARYVMKYLGKDAHSSQYFVQHSKYYGAWGTEPMKRSDIATTPASPLSEDPVQEALDLGVA